MINGDQKLSKLCDKTAAAYRFLAVFVQTHRFWLDGLPAPVIAHAIFITEICTCYANTIQHLIRHTNSLQFSQAGF